MSSRIGTYPPRSRRRSGAWRITLLNRLTSTVTVLAILFVLFLVLVEFLAAARRIPPAEEPTITINGQKYLRRPNGELTAPVPRMEDAWK